MAFQRQTEALAQVAGRLGWDQETVMPEGAAGQRAEEIGGAGRRCCMRGGPIRGWRDWLAAAEAPDAVGEAQLRLIRRSYARTMKVPAQLAEEIARRDLAGAGRLGRVPGGARMWRGSCRRWRKVVELKRDEGGGAGGRAVIPMTRWSMTMNRG